MPGEKTNTQKGTAKVKKAPKTLKSRLEELEEGSEAFMHPDKDKLIIESLG